MLSREETNERIAQIRRYEASVHDLEKRTLPDLNEQYNEDFMRLNVLKLCLQTFAAAYQSQFVIAANRKAADSRYRSETLDELDSLYTVRTEIVIERLKHIAGPHADTLDSERPELLVYTLVDEIAAKYQD